MPRQSDDLFQYRTFLGGQVSHKHQVFKDLARMSPDYAEFYLFIQNYPRWEKEPDEIKVFLEMIELFGEADFVRSCDELTKLSMILGDLMKRKSIKEGWDALRGSGSHP